MIGTYIVRFLKAHGIAVLTIAVLSVLIRIFLHFSFILSFIILFALYLIIGFAIDQFAEKRGLKKGAKRLKEKQQTVTEKQETAAEKQYVRSEGCMTRRASIDHRLKKVSTTMDSIVSQSPEAGKQPAEAPGAQKTGQAPQTTAEASLELKRRNPVKATSDPRFDNDFLSSAERRGGSDPLGDNTSDFIKSNDMMYKKYAERNLAAEANAKEQEETALTQPAETAENAERPAASETAGIAENAETVIQEPAETAPETQNEPPEQLAEAEANTDAAKETDIRFEGGMSEESAQQLAAILNPQDIKSDTEFSEQLTEKVDEMVKENHSTFVRRRRYTLLHANDVPMTNHAQSDQTARRQSSPAPKREAEEHREEIRSHMSEDIDPSGSIFDVADSESSGKNRQKDRVNIDTGAVNELFSAQRQDPVLKPSASEYRRRYENSRTDRQSSKELMAEREAREAKAREAAEAAVREAAERARAERAERESQLREQAESAKAEKADAEETRTEETKARTASDKTAEKTGSAGTPETSEPSVKPQETEKTVFKVTKKYDFPEIGLLSAPEGKTDSGVINAEEDPKAQRLISTLESFGVGAKVVGVMRGPAVTRYEVQPNPGVKVSRIVALADDIALNLASTGVRIEAPIPGKEAVGIEVPNTKVDLVYLRQVIESPEFKDSGSKVTVALGRDIAGKNIVADISKMPHLLIAGATGSGKSVCINTIVASILYKSGPEDVRLIMIDPKIVELGVYNGIPHLLVPVVTNPKKAAGALAWAVSEMERRYTVFSECNVRDIKSYNALAQQRKDIEKMPLIVVIIDELADLMMVAAKEIEDSIIRLAQKARAAGLHLIIATQRPSVDVITGLIKANIPSRIAFAVSSQVDSRTILDGGGAEKLLGRGDMLFHPIGMAKPLRVQGAFVSDSEIERLSENVSKAYGEVVYSDLIQAAIDAKDKPPVPQGGEGENGGEDADQDTEMIEAAAQLAIEYKQLSTSFLQRKLRLGYARASRIVDALESEGLISEADGSKPRQLLMTKEEWEARRAADNG